VDRALVEHAQRGDVEAFDALARMVGDRCMGIARRMLRDHDRAEDAVQGALITAWRELPTLGDADRFEPWLHRIVVNECYSDARKQRRRTVELRVLPPAGTEDHGDIASVHHRNQLERAFRRLTLEQRAVLVFHHYVGLTLVEVADHLDIPVGTAKSRLHHATNALRSSIEADARTPSISQERLA